MFMCCISFGVIILSHQISIFASIKIMSMCVGVCYVESLAKHNASGV